MNNNFKNNKGITLVALVVTIVVLLILAGVSINLVVGQNGIINKAKDAKKNYEDSSKKEEQELQNADAWIDEQLGGLPKGKGTFPYLPSESFTKVDGTNLDNGLVIKDGKGNEYVWIEVPNDGTGPNYGELTKKEQYTVEEYKTMEDAIKKYTTVYRTDYDDVFDADTTVGWFQNETAYNNAKNKMLKSVYENGGFYIGRYEAGIATNRTASGNATEIPVSKPNVYPYRYVTRTQAKVLAEKLSTNTYTNTLMFGMQWDLVLKYLETKGVPQAELKTDSTSWGNYINSTFSITNQKAKKSENDGTTFSEVGASYKKPLNTKVLLTTGADERNSKQNIYDLAGNVWEWTLEKTANNPCAGRGGNCSNNGSNNPASNRSDYSTSDSYDNVGFRFSLYK